MIDWFLDKISNYKIKFTVNCLMLLLYEIISISISEPNTCIDMPENVSLND